MAKLKNVEVIQKLKGIARSNHGMLMPEDVVLAARPTSSVLHSYFTWDNTEAAEKCRLQEARQLINVCVEYIGTENDGKETRVFVSLRDDRKEGGYRTLDVVLTDKSLRESLLDDSLEEMAYFKSKYQSLKELAEVFAAMKSVEKRIRKK